MSQLKKSLKDSARSKSSNRSSTISKGKKELDEDSSFLTAEKMLAESAYWVRS